MSDGRGGWEDFLVLISSAFETGLGGFIILDTALTLKVVFFVMGEVVTFRTVEVFDEDEDVIILEPVELVARFLSSSPKMDEFLDPS